MNRMVTAFIVFGLGIAAPAVCAAEATKPGSGNPADLTAASLSCDAAIEFNAFFQREDRRYGNVFDFGTGAQISRLEFVHDGFATLSGPYDYDVEFWDDAGCTLLGSVTGLQAADAFSASVTESVILCPYNLYFSGMVAVVIHPKSCADSPANTDCYPDLVFDPNLAATCPRVVDTVAGTCTEPLNGGAFLLRIDIDGCPTPVKRDSWGTLKVVYR